MFLLKKKKKKVLYERILISIPREKNHDSQFSKDHVALLLLMSIYSW